MDDAASSESALHELERMYLQKLLLAAQVLLTAAPELSMVSDPLEAELEIFKDRVEFALLLPEFSVDSLPWRKLAGEIARDVLPEDE